MLLKQTTKFISPLTGLVLLSIGSSFLGTLLIIEFQINHATPLVTGLLSTCFYIGYMGAAFKIENFINKIGHVRAYSTFAAIMSIVALLHGLSYNAIFWMFLRFIFGFCNAGMFVVVESWLLKLSSINVRGQILSLYMLSFYIAQALGQFLLKVIPNTGWVPYTYASILATLSIVPLCAIQTQAPPIENVAVLGLRKIFNLSKSGVTGAFISGLILGAIYGFLPFTLKEALSDTNNVGVAMGSLFLGGALLQYPIGKLSDVISRFNLLIAVTLFTLFSAIGVALFINENFIILILLLFSFGGFSFAIYPLSTNLVCDYVAAEKLVEAVGSLLIFYSAGSIIGPFLSPIVVNLFGSKGVFFYIYACCGALLCLMLSRYFVRKPMSVEDQSDFVPAPRTSPVVIEFIQEEKNSNE